MTVTSRLTRTIAIGAAITLAILWLTPLPLGVAGEWTWERTAVEPDLSWNVASGLIAAGLFVGFVLLGSQRLETFSTGSGSRVELIGWLAALVAASFVWIWLVQELSPIENRLGKAAFVLYYPSSSGYFTRARYEEPSPGELLRHYDALMAEGDVLHAGTHPPGLILLFQGLIAACDQSNGLSTFLDETQPGSFREACDVIGSNAVRGPHPRPLLPLDRRVLWLATCLSMFSASLTVLPLFGLLRRHTTAEMAWFCTAFWPGVPAVAMFVPKSDAAFPLLGTTILWLWLTAWDRRSWLAAFLAGLVTWCGLMCSLAFLPVILVAGLMTVGPALVRLIRLQDPTDGAVSTPSDGDAVLEQAICIMIAALGFGVPTFLVWWSTELNLFSVWLANYRNHAGFYGQFPRTYWAWLLVNPLELSFAAGWPVAFLALMTCTNFVASLVRHQTTLSPASRFTVGSIIVVWGLLWVSGKNSSEGARLWILFMPWLIWLASISQNPVTSPKEKSSDQPGRLEYGALLTQYCVCLLTAARVSGFHLDAG